MNNKINEAKKDLPNRWRAELQQRIFDRTGLDYSLGYISNVLNGHANNMVIVQEFITYCIDNDKRIKAIAANLEKLGGGK